MSFEAVISVSTYSNPVDVTGRLLVTFASGKTLPEGVNPKNAVYKSLILKLLA